MATVHFTGDYYAGSDGPISLTLTQPGHYEVSPAKAAQLTADFPQEFSLVPEGTIVSPAKAEAPEEAVKSAATAAADPTVVAEASDPTEAAVEPPEADDKQTKKGK
jgi:hypothetical protein